MKNNTILGSVLSLLVSFSASSPAATLDYRQIESSRGHWMAERKDFDNDPKITSIGQFKDVQPTDEHFQALQSLTERYGVIVTYKDGNFHAKIPLSRGQFAMFLDQGLGIIVQLLESAESDGKFKPFKQFSANNVNLKAVSGIKDLNPQSAYYQSVKSLIERYGIDFVDADGKFRPEKVITEKELQNWLDGVFSTGNNKNARNGNVNRGQFVIRFNDVLDSMNERIAAWTSTNKTEANSSDSQPQNNGESREFVLSGDRRRESDDNQGALAAYNQAIALNPKNDWAYYKRALLKKERLNNDYTGAIADYNQAIALNPKFSDAYTQRGILKRDNLGDYQGALSDLNEAISLNPKSAEAHTVRGSLKYYDLKNYSAALADLDRSILIDPKQLPYFLRAGVKTELKDYRGALADYDRAILISGSMTDFSYFFRGQLKHYQLNDPQGALADYNQAIALNPQWEAPQNERRVLLGNK